MRIPVIKGTIKRRLLVNFRADPAVVQRILPSPFRPKLHKDYALVGICLIRLEKIRPAGLSLGIGISSENAAHRFAVEWTDADGVEREGVYIHRRDTDSILNRMAGGRIFPGEHHRARFAVSDVRNRIQLFMRSYDAAVSIKVAGDEAGSLPVSSCFANLQEASAFFEGGSLGYSVTRERTRYDGLLLRTLEWRVQALSVYDLYSSVFSDGKTFPEGSIQFDHALIMRNILHEWRAAEDLYALHG